MPLDPDDFDTTQEHLFLHQLTKLAEHHTLNDIWGALKAKTVINGSEAVLACADLAMCAGDLDVARRLYEEWLATWRADSAFLPFTRTRIAAHHLLAPILPSFYSLVNEADPLSKLIGVGAMFCLGRWAALEGLCNDQAELMNLDWRVAAAVGFAKAANYDYVKGSAFFMPAILQGAGTGNPYNGRNTSIAQAAEECAAFSRAYTAAERTAEHALIDRGFSPMHTGTPVNLGKVDLFIKTCAKDEEFLVYCLRSIDKFVRGFRRVVLVTDEGHDLRPDLAYDHVVHKITVPNAPTTFDMAAGYRMQMVVKLSWMDFTDADAVVITDSDTIFAGPFAPERMTVDGKPVWYYGGWYEGVLWRAASELVVGAPMPFCCMREHPFIFTREATAGFLDYINRRFSGSIHDLFFAGKIPGKFCEFEILGGYLSHIAHHGYEILPHHSLAIVKQYWSWGGLTDEVKANIDKHLQLSPADA